MNSEISREVCSLVSYANCHLFLRQEDNLYCYNRICALIGAEGIAPQEFCAPEDFLQVRPHEILGKLVDFAIKKKKCTQNDRHVLESELMNVVCPTPSFFCESFDNLAAHEGIHSACTFLYDFCVKSNYIDNRGLFENIDYVAEGKKSPIKISINGIRQDFSPFEEQKNAYPACPLCKENIGTKANASLRDIAIYLGDQEWRLQFSKYCYFNEHFIVVSDKHTPLQIDKGCIDNMLEFVETFPAYFIGCNSNLPRVGASFPQHNHYQGGKTDLPIFAANAKIKLSLPNFPAVAICVPDFYTSCVRFTSRDKNQLSLAVEKVLQAWQKFGDEKIDLVCKSDTVHNTASPICNLQEDGSFVVHLILRNNYANENHPQGVFSCGDRFACIKPSPIGFLEAAGLFILPSRLSSDGHKICDILTGTQPLKLQELSDPKHALAIYLPMILQLINDIGTNADSEAATTAIQNYINSACEKMLAHTAIFKETELGEKSFNKFAKKCGLEIL